MKHKPRRLHREDNLRPTAYILVQAFIQVTPSRHISCGAFSFISPLAVVDAHSHGWSQMLARRLRSPHVEIVPVTLRRGICFYFVLSFAFLNGER